ncbi:unnamed protein product [Ilex paraguariensis]|uniref:Uncharacterized protein n=1 Tax=Ilex paraguariensis TaxID=185542 RepID=A0ABC8RLW0_9AQUA
MAAKREKLLTKVAESFKELANCVESPTPRLEVGQLASACRDVATIIGCLGMAFKFVFIAYSAKVDCIRTGGEIGVEKVAQRGAEVEMESEGMGAQVEEALGEARSEGQTAPTMVAIVEATPSEALLVSSLGASMGEMLGEAPSCWRRIKSEHGGEHGLGE